MSVIDFVRGDLRTRVYKGVDERCNGENASNDRAKVGNKVEE